MGLYKICAHTGRARDRCEHAWWGSFRGKRVSLAKWANREIRSKAEADAVLGDLRTAVRAGTFDERGVQPRPDSSALTFQVFADLYKERHVLAKGLALASTIDYRLKPLIDRFGDRVITEIRTADIEDFVADFKKPRVVNGKPERMLAPASINRTLGLLRHMLNWAVGREYLDRTPFRRGTEVLIRMEREDNRRRRRISEQEEAALLAVAPSHLRSMIIAALDTGMRRGEMLAFRDLLGHASILTTERYDNQKLEALQAAVQRLETGKRFDPADAPLEEDKVSRIFQDPSGKSLITLTTASTASSIK